jgi:hypothetical protein
MTTLFHRLAEQLCGLSTPIRSALCQGLNFEMLFWQPNANFIASVEGEETLELTDNIISLSKAAPDKQAVLIDEEIKEANTNVTKPITADIAATGQQPVKNNTKGVINVKLTKPVNINTETALLRPSINNVDAISSNNRLTQITTAEVIRPVTKTLWRESKQQQRNSPSITETAQVSAPLYEGETCLIAGQQTLKQNLVSDSEKPRFEHDIAIIDQAAKFGAIQPLIKTLWQESKQQQRNSPSITETVQTAASLKNQTVKIRIGRIKVGVKSIKSSVAVTPQQSSHTRGAKTISLIDYLTRHSWSS